MKRFNQLLVFCLMLIWCLPIGAQQVIIKDEFKEVPMASVLTLYKNQFGSWEKPDLDVPFPYALIHVKLDGNAQEVKAAKRFVSLYMGRLTGVLAKCTEMENELSFLVPARTVDVAISCGDGCARQTIFEKKKLLPNRIYSGRIHYIPAEDAFMKMDSVRTHSYTFEITPANAILELVINGDKQPWSVTDGKVEMELGEGKYFYTVTADNYHTQEGTINVSDLERRTVVDLRPKYGWLSMASTEQTDGAFVNIANMLTRQTTLLSIPTLRHPMESGTYELVLRKPRFYDFVDTITISDGELTTITPLLITDDRMVMKTFILANAAYSFAPQWSYGAMFGQTYNGVGWFVKGRANYQSAKNTNGLVCDKMGAIDGITPFYTGKNASSTWMANAGVVIDILELSIKPDHYFDTFGCYIGGGYGVYQHAWEMTSGDWVEYGPTSMAGFSGSIGLMGSVRGFTLMAGVTTINFKNIEVEAGIGWMF